MRRSVLRRKTVKGATWAVILSFVLAGCATKEHMTDYYAVEQARSDAIIASINAQAVDRGSRQVLMMQTYSSSMTSAAITASPVDDAMIAMAWGYQMGSKDDIIIPKFAPIKAPPTNVDYIRAWSPIVGMAIPLLWGAVWSGNNSGSGGNSYAADNGGSIILDSGNPGSYNSVGGDYGLGIEQTDYALINNIQGFEGTEGDGVGGDNLPEGDCYTDGYENEITGKWYTDASQSCSCGSNAAGEC